MALPTDTALRTAGPRAGRLRTVLAGAAVVALAVVVAVGVTRLGFLRTGHHDAFVAWSAIAWAVFVIAMVGVRAVPTRIVPAIVLGGGLLVGIAALLGPPNTSSDSARYAWDGIVQLHGISPYLHTPDSHVLAGIRPDWLFGHPTATVQPSTDGPTYCPGDRIQTAHDNVTNQRLCTPINRPSVPTIYPPMAELWFALVRSAVPVTATYWPMQVAGLVVVMAVTVGLLVVLRRTGRPAWWAALWAWCPLVASEAVTNSHVDVLGAALATVGAVLVAGAGARTRAGARARAGADRIGIGRTVLGGIALGAATSTKLIPAIAFPALLGRGRAWWSLVAAILTFGVLYVPYVATTGVRVIGYLPGYLSEEGYDDGTRFALVSAVTHGGWATLVVALVVVVAAVIAWRVSDPAAPWSGQVLMIGVTLLAVSPRYPWYALLLVPFVALSGRWEWLTIAAAMLLRQLHPSVHVYREALLVSVVVIVVVTLVRTRPADWRRWRERLFRRRILAG